jgi:hypothetical protein
VIKIRIKNKDRIGQKINYLTILEISKAIPSKTGKSFHYNCKAQCDCGNIIETDLECVTQGHTKSCGCKRRTQNLAKNRVFQSYKSNAKKRNLDFHLNIEEFELISSQNCFYCGDEPSNQTDYYGDSFIYNGIDRVDNSKGYMIGNVVSCCKTCNYAKREKSYEEFTAWLRRVSKQWQGR